MNHNSFTSVFIRKLKTLLLILPFFIFSCEKWTPQADGYFIVDNKRYNVYIMTIYNASEISLQGAPYVNVTMFLSYSGPGKYHVSYGYQSNGINALDVRWSAAGTISSDFYSSGTMTIAVSGNNYVMDFDGHIQGHSVQIHYSGLVSSQ